MSLPATGMVVTRANPHLPLATVPQAPRTLGLWPTVPGWVGGGSREVVAAAEASSQPRPAVVQVAEVVMARQGSCTGDAQGGPSRTIQTGAR